MWPRNIEKIKKKLGCHECLNVGPSLFLHRQKVGDI